MLEMLLSAAGGGIFGLIGSGIKSFMSYKDKKLTLAHTLDMAKQEVINMKAEMELATLKGEIDLELQESASDAESLQAAINAESKVKGASPWVDDLRASTRPILTYSLCLCAFAIVMIDNTNPWANDFIFMATTAVTFWFGDRPRKNR